MLEIYMVVCPFRSLGWSLGSPAGGFSFRGLLITVETPESACYAEWQESALGHCRAEGESLCWALGRAGLCHRHQGSWCLGENLDTESMGPWS